MNKFNKKNLIFVLQGGMLVMAIVFGISTIITPKFESTTKLLFIQKQLSGIDVYTASKSSERIASSFVEIIHSNKFLNLILENTQIKKSYFSSEDKSEDWKKMVDISLIKGTGIIEISIFHPERKQAELIANQIFKILSERGDEFHGGGSNIAISSLSDPVASERPVSPNIWLNSLIGFTVGIVGMTLIIYLKIEERENNSITASQENQEIRYF